MPDMQRPPAELRYADELELLRQRDRKDNRPVAPGWQLSAQSVVEFVLGDGQEVTSKYVGRRSLVERCVVSLATNRGLMLIGEPGTAKSLLSELLAAAISGDTTLTIQGSAATTEDAIKYSWNYAMLLAEGPTLKSLVPAPVHRGMSEGKVVRFEEITRCAPEVQDSMLSVLSDRTLSIPELDATHRTLYAKRGFNVIGTANTRDRGVNEMSSALKRRFNIIVLPAPATLETEVSIVTKRVTEIANNYRLKAALPTSEAIEKIVTIFRELRKGATLDEKQKLKSPSGVISTAEAISLITNSMALAGSFGNGTVSDTDLASGLQGAVVKDEDKDKLVWKEYLENVMKKRGAAWRELYNSCSEMNS